MKRFIVFCLLIFLINVAFAQQKQQVESNKKTVEAFFIALEKQNFEDLKRIFTVDAKQINPYIPNGFPSVLDGREAIYKQYSSLPQQFSRMQFPREIYATEDPSVFFVHFKGKIDIIKGGMYENDYVGIFKLRESKIYEYTEYFNPIVMANAFGISLD
ncbi:MAG: nuclear transport factor 2 family protein [Thermonemataceae bacterium]